LAQVCADVADGDSMLGSVPPTIVEVTDGEQDPVGTELTWVATHADGRDTDPAAVLRWVGTALVIAAAAAVVAWAVMQPGFFPVGGLLMVGGAIIVVVRVAVPVRPNPWPTSERTLGPGVISVRDPHGARLFPTGRVRLGRRGVEVRRGWLAGRRVAWWPWDQVSQVEVSTGPASVPGLVARGRDGSVAAITVRERSMAGTPAKRSCTWTEHVQRASASPRRGSPTLPPLMLASALVVALFVIVGGALLVQDRPGAGRAATPAPGSITPTPCVQRVLEPRDDPASDAELAGELAVLLAEDQLGESWYESSGEPVTSTSAGRELSGIRLEAGVFQQHHLAGGHSTRWASSDIADLQAGAVSAVILEFATAEDAAAFDETWAEARCAATEPDALASDLPGASNLVEDAGYGREITFRRGDRWVQVSAYIGSTSGEDDAGPAAARLASELAANPQPSS
jgi:hypothetical protein